MRGSRKKCEKSPFLVILGQNGQFWTVFGQNGKNGNFFQKSAWNISEQFQKKVMNGFRETALRTDERTDERTNERTNERTDVIP